MTQATAPAYTVAMCTHNHADRLVRTLADLPRVRPPRRPWELLVIDNGSTDTTPRLLRDQAWPPGWQVRVVREDKLGLSNARNRAVAEARGTYIVFIDDDETADPDWLCAFERLIDAQAPDAFGGRIRVLFEDQRPAWLADELLGFLGELDRGGVVAPLTDPETSFFGGNFGCRRSVFDRVGGFDAGLGRKGGTNTGGEEVDFYRRLLDAGLRVWWTPEAVIHHRIQAAKLERRYFLDLHYRQGRVVGSRARQGSRLPPPYLFGQALRAYGRALRQRLREGADRSLRLEMNAAYFTGYLLGWVRPPR
ncbi:MAG: glycosyltransferase family 2 protein [Burkholderiales bacterium]|nr:glycosyltransferase family 2 protein [Burkholderiales bacterium]